MVSSSRKKGAIAGEPPTAPDWRRLVVWLCLAPGAAMAERFDAVTFDAPPGWSRQATASGLAFETHPSATDSCRIDLRKSRARVQTLAQELDRDWSALIARQTLIGDSSTPAQLSLDQGTTLAQRFAQVRTGNGTSFTMLNLFQRDDRLVTVVVTADPQSFQRCESAIGAFLAGLRLDQTAATAPPAQAQPLSDPQLAARFGNSVVGTWRYAMTAVSVTLNAPTQTRNLIEVRFAPEGTYRITNSVGTPGSSSFAETESGTYRTEGQRILMRPAQAGGGGPRPYVLDWFFGDHPDYRGNWGLILRSNASWPGGDQDRWRTFKPAQ